MSVTFDFNESICSSLKRLKKLTRNSKSLSESINVNSQKSSFFFFFFLLLFLFLLRTFYITMFSFDRRKTVYVHLAGRRLININRRDTPRAGEFFPWTVYVPSTTRKFALAPGIQIEWCRRLCNGRYRMLICSKICWQKT